MKYPESFAYFVVDDIREEVGQKITLVGIYAGGNVVLSEKPKEGTTLAIPGLAIFATFRGGDGQFKLRVNILGPSGNELHTNTQEVTFSKEKAYTLNVMAFVRPFVVNEFGTYKIHVFLNERMYEGTFEIQTTAD